MAQVFLGMSGGVDSSAAAVLLLERGYCVHGLHLSLLNTLPLPENCPPEDGSDARAVAQALELPFHDLDLSERFRQTVAAYFIREYEAGRTPNPCVFCNREIKFGAMWDAAQALGADYLATGHYANAARDPVSGRYLLRRGADRAKDQSYFLCRLTQEQLSHTLFPLGGLTKPQVRELAEARGLADCPEAGQSGHLLCPGRGLCGPDRPLCGTRFPGGTVSGAGRARARPAQGLRALYKGAAQGAGIGR